MTDLIQFSVCFVSNLSYHLLYIQGPNLGAKIDIYSGFLIQLFSLFR